MKARTRIAAALAVLLAAGTPDSHGETVLLDGFENTDYRITSIGGDTASILGRDSRTQGERSLEIAFTYAAHEAWTGECGVAKILPAITDLGQLDFITFDINIPVAQPALMFGMDVLDEYGAVARIVDLTFFAQPTKGWEKRFLRFSSFQKTKWAGQGRAADLKRIKSFAMRVFNHEATTAAGTFRFCIDNMQVVSAAGKRIEAVLEDFEIYKTDALLVDAWRSSGVVAGDMDTTEVFEGRASLRVEVPGNDGVSSVVLMRNLDQPVDFSQAVYARIAVRGAAISNSAAPVAKLLLVDKHGNRAEGIVKAPAAKNRWADVLLPFREGDVEGYTTGSETALSIKGASCWREAFHDGQPWQQATDLAQIAAIGVAVEAGPGKTLPPGAVFRFDRIVAGYPMTALPPQPVAATEGAVVWQPLDRKALADARSARKAAVLYFARHGVSLCQKLERDCFDRPDIRSACAPLACLRCDPDAQADLARERGVFRVPFLVFVDADGRTVQTMSGDIACDELKKNLLSLGQ